MSQIAFINSNSSFVASIRVSINYRYTLSDKLKILALKEKTYNRMLKFVNFNNCLTKGLKGLPATILSISFLLLSCDKKEPGFQKIQSTNQIPVGILQLRNLDKSADEIGQFHNDLLEKFMSDNPNYELVSFEKLISDITLSSDFIQSHPNYEMIQLMSVDRPTNSSFTLTHKGVLTFEDMLKQTYEGSVSQNVKKALDHIVENQLTYVETHQYLTHYLKSNHLSTSDIEVLSAFDTFSGYSANFWENHSSNSKNKHNLSQKGCNAQTQQYLADGFGFLLGGGLGALGYSAAIHILQDEGQHCI